jgi:hypothetical protein
MKKTYEKGIRVTTLFGQESGTITGIAHSSLGSVSYDVLWDNGSTSSTGHFDIAPENHPIIKLIGKWKAEMPQKGFCCISVGIYKKAEQQNLAALRAVFHHARQYGRINVENPDIDFKWSWWLGEFDCPVCREKSKN